MSTLNPQASPFNADGTQSTPVKVCQVCGLSGTAERPILHCSKCRNKFYCSRTCQAVDWRQHKRTCGKNAEDPGDVDSDKEELPKSSKGKNAFAVREPFKKMHNRTWLEDRSKKSVFKLLVDAYRLRVEDNYTFKGDLAEDSLYGGGDPLVGFRRFLKRAERFKAPATRSVLPTWWSETKRKECEKWAREAIGKDSGEWSDLSCAVEKHDITEHYGDDSTFPMQLRMLAEEVEGSPVSSFGATGSQMSALMSGLSMA